MELLSNIFALLSVLSVRWVSSLSSICREGEDQFIILDSYNNIVYANGKEVTRSKVISLLNGFFPITEFCIPLSARVIAVTNELHEFKSANLVGSLGDRMVTNKEWRCVEMNTDGDWFGVKYDDRKWPQAFVNPTPAKLPNISQNALSISASPNASKKYYCRAWIGGRPSIHELYTQSAYAAKTGSNQRLMFHLIESFLVDDIFKCVTHCQDYEECVSVNFENSENGELKICELNSEAKTSTPGHTVINNDFDYYDIIKP